ncbi:MAG: hypothetical protein AAF481_13680 [Acidobacteriota bacterium]
MNSMREHPIVELDRLIRGSASKAERSRAIRHLLAGCPSCAERIAREVGWETARGTALPADLVDESAWHRARSRKAERADAERIEAVLERLSVDVASWVEDVRQEARGTAALAEALAEGKLSNPLEHLDAKSVRQRRSLCEQLIERSIAARQEDPKVTLRCAEMAMAIADDALADGEAAQFAELRVRVWSELGNARRISNDLAGSDAAFAKAGRYLDELPQCDPLLKAEYLSLLASLRDYQRRMKEALTLLRQAAVIYQRHGSDDAMAKVLIKEASILAKAGEVEQGLQAVWSGLQRIGPDADLSLVMSGIQNLLHLMIDRGAYGEAAHLVDAVEPLYRRFAGRMLGLRLDWLKARIDLETKGPEAGVRSLEAVRQRFLDHDLPFETAVVSLDLAQVFASTGDTVRLHETARQMIPIFQQLDVTRDLIGILATLRAVSLRQEAALTLIERLRQGLGVAAFQPL